MKKTIGIDCFKLEKDTGKSIGILYVIELKGTLITGICGSHSPGRWLSKSGRVAQRVPE